MLVSKTFLIAGTVAVAGIVSGALTTSREPTTTQAHADGSTVFAARWDTTGMRQDVPPMKKQDRLEPVPMISIPVQEPVHEPKQDADPPPPKKVAAVDDDNDDEEAHRPRKHHARNLCERHGMHKVITRGGRSWRCR